MRTIILTILLFVSFIGFAQVKEDSSMRKTSPKRNNLSALDQLPDYSILLKDNKEPIDSNYINIYYSTNSTNFPIAIYMDSLRVSSLSVIDPKDILDVKIIKGIDSINKINGKVFVTLKKHLHHFITIAELTKRCIPNYDSKVQPIIYMVDDKLITDITNMMFEITYIRDIEVVEGSQIKAFAGLLSNVTLLKIYTKSAGIVLRGNPTLVSFKQ